MFKPVNERLRLEGLEIGSTSELVATYRSRLRELGLCGRTMFYRNEEQHQRKITQFAAIVRRLVSPLDSLLDVGCGYGSFAGVASECKYLGIDVVPEFVDEARRRHPELDFRIASVEECQDTCDWCILLGVVNGVPNPSEIVQASWARCRRGLIVDFVDRRLLPETFADLNRFDIGECVVAFLELGAQFVEVHPTTSVWSIVVARRERATLA